MWFQQHPPLAQKERELIPDEYNLPINCKWISGEKKLEVRNPYDQEILGTVPEAAKELIYIMPLGVLKRFLRLQNSLRV